MPENDYVILIITNILLGFLVSILLPIDILQGTQRRKYACFGYLLHRFQLESKLTTHLIKNEKSSNFLDTLLDGNESYEVIINFIKLVLDSFFEHEFINGTCRVEN